MIMICARDVSIWSEGVEGCDGLAVMGPGRRRRGAAAGARPCRFPVASGLRWTALAGSGPPGMGAQSFLKFLAVA
jgi:hypothetical protein